MPSGSSLLRLAILLFLCLILTIGPFSNRAWAQTPDDHGDLPDNTATPLTLGTTVTGLISPGGDIDVFRFEIPGTATDVWIYTQGGISDSVGVIYDSRGTRIASNDDSVLSTNESHFYIGANLGPGTYYVEVSGYGTETGKYSLHTRTGTDQGGTVGAAADLTLGAPVEGVIGPAWEKDVFRIDLSTASGPTDVVLYTSSNLDTIGEILDDNFRQLASNDDSILSDERYDFFLGAVLEPGVYYIFVSGYGTSAGPYKLYSWTGTDQPGSRAASAALPLKSEQLGVIGSSTDEDYFRITVATATDVHVYATGPTDTIGELQDSSGTRLAYNDDSDFSLGSTSFFIAKSLSPGTYYVTVSGFAGETGPYRVYAKTVADQSNAKDTAEELTRHIPVIGLIDPANDADLFKLELYQSKEVFIYTTGDVDTVGELLKSDGTALLAQNDDHSFGAGLNFFIRRELDAGTYYIRVQGYQQAKEPETGLYALFAEPVRSVELETIPLEIIFEGYIAEVYDENYYKIDIANTTDAWIFDTGALDTIGTLYDSNLNEIAFNDDSRISGRYRAFHIRETLDPGTYYVKAGSSGTDTGRYAVHFYAVTEPHNNSETSAAPLEPGLPTPGRIDSDDETEYFRLYFTENINISLYGRSVSGAYVKGEVLDSLGNTVGVNEYALSQGDGFIIRDTFAPGTYYVKVTTPPGAASRPIPYTIHAFKDTLYTEFVAGCTAETARLTTPGLTFTAGDDLYACQWHLKNREDEGEDINVEPVWAEGITGQGVNVAVVDDGMDHKHEDLAPNVYASRNFDYTGEGDVYHSFEHHGTAVAGVIAARDNSFGVRGVAPRAAIHGHNYLAEGSDFALADSMTRNRVVTAVSNNSWGLVDGPGLGSADAFWKSAVEAGVEEGYGGKGTFYSFPAGNGALEGDDANLDEITNFYAVTSVCAVNDRGRRSNFSEPGAPLWVCAPSNDLRGNYRDIVTTENSDRYRYTFGGTSAATPIVSGVAALLRQANPDLTWRDLKLVLAASARKNDPGNSGWEDGARKYGSDSATDVYTFNHEYGFGVVDAKAALDLAKGWITVAPLESEEVESAKLDRPIPDVPATGASTMVSHTLALDTGIEFIEFVEVRASFRHSSFRDLEIELVSPSGKVSKLLSHYDSDGPIPFIPFIPLIPLNGEIRFGAAGHLGEDPNGRWTLRISDRIPLDSGSLDSWTIKVYGHRPAPSAPTVDSVTPGLYALTVAWSAPAVTRGAAVAAYDLRYITTAAAETDDANWTVVENAWTATGGGALTYGLTGLADGVQYDVQVRAVNAAGPGPWSETVAGIPAVGASGCSAAVPSPTINPELAADCDALLALRDTLANDAPLNWSAHLPLADWDGVTMGGSPPRVTGLRLSDRALAGQIPYGLGSLTALQVLDLSNSGLTGTIPTELGSLRSLEVLSLRSNQLTGPIPSSLGSLRNLERLHLFDNQLTGLIPHELGNLANVVELSLWWNQLRGQIPDRMGDLANLQKLELGENRLTGPIPSSLGDLTSLEVLSLQGNRLTGPIPSSLGNLTSLKGLYLYENQLTGPIPSSLGNLTDLEELYLNHNQLTGAIPPELGGLASLIALSLSQNPLGGAIPPELRNLSKLIELHLSQNQLSGTIPPELGRLTNLRILALGGNQLTGPIPTWLGNLTGLQELHLSQNQLSGPIPPELGRRTNLGILDLGGNQLTGPVPTWLGNLTGLQELHLSQNQLSGPIPPELASLTNLVNLQLSDNQLTGPIPPELGRRTNLRILALGGNQLTGPVPTWLGNLTDLEWLHLSQNQLSGTIPSQLASLTNLQGLDLWGNQLSGTIPPQLGGLTSLQELYLSRNQLDGCVPQGLRDVADNDFDDLGLPFCDVLLGSLTISPGSLTPPFDPYHTDYAAVVGPSRVTVTPVNEHNAAFQFIDQNRGEITDADGSLEGLQVDLGAGVTTIRIRVISPDGLGSRTYTIQVSPCATRGAVTNAANNRRLVSDCDALLATRDVLAGSATLNWSATLPIADWDGVTLGESPLRVTRLTLRESQLTGTIPPELGRLTNLGILALGGNQLTGPIPAWLGGLANLQTLDLSYNQLTGEIPGGFGDFANLIYLHLHDNQLSGEIPGELGNMASLSGLGLSGNQLTGEIPAELGNLANLQSLNLNRNQLTGEMPSELSGLTNLEWLDLWENQLTGPIPAELGSLTNLQGLHLSYNQLTGEIPTELANLTNLEVLALGGNQLTGTVPAWLGSLANLQELYLWGNELTGEIPTELGSLTSLQGLYLAENQLTGPIPSELGGLTNLQTLWLDSNELTGSIPAELGGLPSLEWLNLSENQLTGPIPASLGGLANLQQLSLSQNQLSGAIPPELSRLTNLERLSLSQNMLTGCVPEAWRDIAESDVLELGLPFCAVSLNTAPVFSDSEGNPITEAGRSVVENTAAGENVGAPVTATDVDMDIPTYTLGGEDAASFDIDSMTGQLMTKAPLDFEAEPEHTLTVMATDPSGASAMISVTVKVTNVEEPGTVTLDPERPVVGEMITANLDDPDGDVTGDMWQWAKRSMDMTTWDDIPGATAAAYTPVEGDDGYYLRATAMYTDGEGMGKMASEETMMVVAMAGDQLLAEYDPNGDGVIEKADMRKAVAKFFKDPPDLTREEMRRLVAIFFS